MDILNISTPKNIKIPTFCHPKILNPKIPLNRYKLTSPFHRNSLPLYLSTSTTKKFQTFAHFNRPTNRRNSLRKKLLHDHQVRPNHIPTDPSSVSSNVVEENSVNFQRVSVDEDSVVELEKPESKSKLLGESVLLNKFENWVDQYRKDIEYWGLGSSPIFTVYQDSSGSVKRVSVDEDEILRRSKVQRDVIEDLSKLKSKILVARNMAREMENGSNVIAKNSSVTKFVVQGEEEVGFVKVVRSFVVQPRLLPRISGVGSKVLIVLVVLWAVKKLFSFGDKEVRYTEAEKKMMMRKIKARKEKELLGKGAVEVIPKPLDTPMTDVKKPKLDKEQLKNNILKAKSSADKLLVQNSSADVRTGSSDMDYKVREIREMARRAREIEGRDDSLVSKDMEVDDPVIEKSSNENELIKKLSKQDDSLSNHQNEVAMKTTDSNAILQTSSVDVEENIDNPIMHEVVPAGNENLQASDVVVPGDREVDKRELEINEIDVHPEDEENEKFSGTPINGSLMRKESSVKKRPRIIRSVKEARDYLSKKRDKQSEIEFMKENAADLKSSTVVDFNDQKGQNLEMNTIVSRSDTVNGVSDSKPDIIASEDSNQEDRELSPTENESLKDSGIEPGLEDLQKSETALDDEVNGIDTETSLSGESLHEVEPKIKQITSDALNGISDSKPSINPSEDSDQKDKVVGDLEISETTSDHEVNGVKRETKLSGKTENWLEQNFHEVEPIIKQIRAGFRDNYMVAKERVDQPLDIPTEMESLGVVEDSGGELDWMQDDHLRDIVFRVRDNELSGRDPFHLMNDEDKEAFFTGLEKKVEKENKKLSHLHEYLHSNIENLDYGTGSVPVSQMIKSYGIENLINFKFREAIFLSSISLFCRIEFLKYISYHFLLNNFKHHANTCL